MVKIVIIDDDTAVLDAIRRALESNAWDLETFKNPVEGVAYCHHNPPDLVISDIRMRGMNGIEVMEDIADRIPRAGRIALSDDSSKQDVVDAVNRGHIHFYIEKPWNDQYLMNIVTQAINSAVTRKENDKLSQKIQKQNVELAKVAKSLDKKVSERTYELREVYTATIHTFASLIEKRFKPFEFSNRDVAGFCEEFAHVEGLSQAQCLALNFAATLRNIGKLSFSDQLLNTPYFMMNHEERENYEKHPLHAYAALSLLPPLKHAAKIILNHQERFDGRGYPAKIKGAEIPIESQMLLLCSDYFDLQNGSIENYSCTKDEAKKYIQDSSGTRYDEKLVENFLKLKLLDLESELRDNEYHVESHALKPGMEMSRDIYSEAGVLLLVKGTKISESVIDHIFHLESNAHHKFDFYVRE